MITYEIKKLILKRGKFYLAAGRQAREKIAWLSCAGRNHGGQAGGQAAAGGGCSIFGALSEAPQQQCQRYTQVVAHGISYYANCQAGDYYLLVFQCCSYDWHKGRRAYKGR